MSTNKELLQKLCDIALNEVGIREEGGNNNGAKIREYQKATWLEPASWAWCAALQCWIMKEWIKIPEVIPALGKDNFRRCLDASAFGWEKWAKVQGFPVLPETVKAKAGDLVIFDFSHIGIVVEDQVGKYINTVEGNTNGKGERDSVSGDGVWKKTRHFSLTKCYIRLLE